MDDAELHPLVQGLEWLMTEQSQLLKLRVLLTKRLIKTTKEMHQFNDIPLSEPLEQSSKY
jgi:hypothetical protein